MIEFLKFGASWVLPPGIFFVLFLGYDERKFNL